MLEKEDLSAPCDLIEARRLASQYQWRLLPIEAWVAAARQINPAPADAKAARSALLAAYGSVLHSACGGPNDMARREQAYRELYDYLWQQAYYWRHDLACDIAQEAIVLIFRSFTEPGLARCTNSATFLDFAQGKLRAARTNIWRECDREGKHVSLEEDDRAHQERDRPVGIELADTRPGPEECTLHAQAQTERQEVIRAEMQAQTFTATQPRKPAVVRNQELDNMRAGLRAEIQAKTQDERRTWSQLAIPKLIVATLRALQKLWQISRLRRQLATVIHTYVDRVSDDETARRLNTTLVNVQPLRSRGLDRLAERLYGELAVGQGG